MNKKDAKIFLDALTELEKEKGISKESLLETVEQALLAAYKKHYGDEENNVKVIIKFYNFFKKFAYLFQKN